MIETISPLFSDMIDSVFSQSKEVGITVNGFPATVYGDKFTARVRLAEGSNSIKATAIDGNGATAEATVPVTVISTNPVRIVTNIESGTGPIEAMLRIEGFADGTKPQITTNGPGTVEFLECTDFEACRIRVMSEGIYYITATGTAYDGKTYSDTIAITVLNRAEIDAILKTKWEGMKGALLRGDVEGAMLFFNESSRQRYGEIFTALGSALSPLVQNMRDIQLIYVKNGTAKYRIRKNEMYNGQITEITYYIYFRKDVNAVWNIYRF